MNSNTPPIALQRLRLLLNIALAVHGCQDLLLLGIVPLLSPVTDVGRITAASPLPTIHSVFPKLAAMDDDTGVRAAAMLFATLALSRLAAGALLRTSSAAAVVAAASYLVEILWIGTETHVYHTVGFEEGDHASSVLLPLCVLMIAAVLVLRVDDTFGMPEEKEPEGAATGAAIVDRASRSAAAKAKVTMKRKGGE